MTTRSTGDPPPLPVEVECYAGYRGEETPRRIRMGSRTMGVVDVLDRWLSEDHRYFKLLCDDRCEYILRHDEPSWQWELIFFRIRPCPTCANKHTAPPR